MWKLPVLFLLLLLAGCGGLSGNEQRFVSDVRSSTSVTMSDAALVQAGRDTCDNKPIDYVNDLATELIITGAASHYLC